MNDEFKNRLKVDTINKDEIRKKEEETAIESALLEKKNGMKDSIAHIITVRSRDKLSLYRMLDSERKELIERIGTSLKDGKISDKHFTYFSSYRNLSRFMDKYLERLQEIIKSEPSGEIIVEPDIDQEMENIMREELEEDKYNTIE